MSESSSVLYSRDNVSSTSQAVYVQISASLVDFVECMLSTSKLNDFLVIDRGDSGNERRLGTLGVASKRLILSVVPNGKGTRFTLGGDEMNESVSWPTGGLEVLLGYELLLLVLDDVVIIEFVLKLWRSSFFSSVGT